MDVYRLFFNMETYRTAFFWMSAVLLLSNTIGAQPVSDWDRDFGGSGWEELNSIQQTSDEGYIIAGYSSSSSSGDISDPTEGLGDFWLVKTDLDGNLEWEERYGGNGEERPYSVQQTTDGGYIIGGWSFSGISGDKTQPSRGAFDYWVVKTDALGVIEWDRTYGGDNTDILYDLIQTSDGGYILGGNSMSGISGEKTAANRGGEDFWVLKIDASGNVEWDRTYGGVEEERLNVILEDDDGNFVIGGGSRSDVGGEVTTSLLGVKDFWMIKVDQINGNILWERRYGGTDEDELRSMVKTSDGGYLLGGGSRSDQLLNRKSENARGIVDMWVVKTDAAGNIEWDRTLGGANLDNCYNVKQNSIGKYIIGGFSGSPAGGDKTEPNLGGWDFWLIYLDDDGTKLWDKTLGGSSNDVMENLFQTSDGGYLLAGHSASDISGDKTSANKGLNDFWIVKTRCNLSVEFKDTIVCPNAPVILNAYDPTCTDCSWRWNDNNTDSIRMVSTPVSTTYQVTLTDGVGCARFDDINITISSPPSLELGNDYSICDSSLTVIGPADPSLKYQWSTGDTSIVLVVDSAAMYRLTVTDAMGCTSEDSIRISTNPLPLVDLGPDTILCPSESVLLNAGNTGANFEWSDNSNNQFLEVFTTGIFSVTVTDGNNCERADTIEIRDYQVPQVSNITTVCDASNTFYTLSFDITGGDPNNYRIIGGVTGIVTNGTFVSNPIPRGFPYSLRINDNRGCNPVLVEGDFDCGCSTSSAELEEIPLRICGPGQVEMNIINPATLDSNDVSIFILHDGSNITIGNIIATNTEPVFSFLPGQMSYDVVYWITPIAGNGNGGGTVNMSDGCLSSSEGVFVVFHDTPEARIIPQGALTLTCEDSIQILDGSSSQLNSPNGNLEFEWQTSGSGNIIGSTTSPSIEVDQQGTYRLIVTNSVTTCKDTISVMVEAEDELPTAQIELPDVFTCLDTMIQLDGSNSSSTANFTHVWSGGSIDGFSGLQPTVDEPGTYSLLVTNTDNGCSATATITVQADLTAPQVSIGGSTYLDCLTNSVELEGMYTANGDVVINWNTASGNILEGESSLSPMVDEPGNYQLIVTDIDNGCVGMDEVTVTYDPNVPQDADLLVEPPVCFGDENGRIIIQSVVNGQEPYLYSINDGPFSAQNEFVGLGAGSYHLRVQDANGCEWDTMVTIEQPEAFVVSIGTDGDIQLGEEVWLRPQFNQILDTFFWTPNIDLSCQGCLNPSVSPTNTTTYRFEAINLEGCKASAAINVVVRKERLVYIPTAFTPNSDGFNDRLVIYGGRGVAQINYFRIFDRWGELVYELNDALPNQELSGWDGKFKGKYLDNGVYIFVGEIAFTDGYTELYKGDITLLR